MTVCTRVNYSPSYDDDDDVECKHRPAQQIQLIPIPKQPEKIS